MIHVGHLGFREGLDTIWNRKEYSRHMQFLLDLYQLFDHDSASIVSPFLVYLSAWKPFSFLGCENFLTVVCSFLALFFPL